MTTPSATADTLTDARARADQARERVAAAKREHRLAIGEQQRAEQVRATAARAEVIAQFADPAAAAAITEAEALVAEAAREREALFAALYQEQLVKSGLDAKMARESYSKAEAMMLQLGTRAGVPGGAIVDLAAGAVLDDSRYLQAVEREQIARSYLLRSRRDAQRSALQAEYRANSAARDARKARDRNSPVAAALARLGLGTR